ncbi:hypothetical protein [Vibrio gazogenes]|uniref:Uncharacterized protein n=1 Tax=Vibrio gazogenes DSM 21264 = NBRC 103151 TaxID=1123492 RepID=A0A1M5C9C7_VIBGA|nr:hypothetical protein [Vibrio gazogenes]USP16285.1 hypothetical protein MKS89_18050 [Vibrio gazogenes]SHF51353.1 hypothetical protein SAMN02745781_02497 [Vibrio gazogenes DSM 21264] [Vibrio gazogenes DSM 21264 = NBRC 103151]SJN55386.1 hypothetical protein BQ6471_01528 [Vibrio gazogenes]
MNNKIKELEYIADEAELAMLALSSMLLMDYKGVAVLQRKMHEISQKAHQLIAQETRQRKEVVYKVELETKEYHPSV